jgi:hypothetical protein
MVLLERFYNEDVVLGGADLSPAAWAGTAGAGPAEGEQEPSAYVCPEPGGRLGGLRVAELLVDGRGRSARVCVS